MKNIITKTQSPFLLPILTGLKKPPIQETSFNCAIGCIDGRTIIPLTDFVRQRYKAEFIDLITFPGPTRAFHEKNQRIIQEIDEQIKVSLKAHHSKVIVVSAHFDCAANPLSKNKASKEVKSACLYLHQKYPQTSICGVWINRDWAIELIIEYQALRSD